MPLVAAIIVNFRTGPMTVEALASLMPSGAEPYEIRAFVVDNDSGDGSADFIEAAIEKNGWGGWASVIRSPVNGGFSAGNNLVMKSVKPDFFLLLNSDAQLRPGALARLVSCMANRRDVGLVGPRLEDDNGDPQHSSFRYHTPISEFMRAASTGPIDKILERHKVPLDVSEDVIEADWISFACVLIRRDVVDAIGLLDEGYFLYFDDIDYCRRAKVAGWKAVTDPSARVFHLCSGSTKLNTSMSKRARLPKYHYASRARYFAKYYGGRCGVFCANAMWLVGRTISLARQLAGKRRKHVCAREGLDNWTFFWNPMQQFQPEQKDGR